MDLELLCFVPVVRFAPIDCWIPLGSFTFSEIAELSSQRLAEASDLLFPRFSSAYLESKPRSRLIFAVAAYADDLLIGLVVAESCSPQRAKIISLKVEERWRRQGVATELLRSILKASRAKGCSRLNIQYLQTRLTRLALEPILARCGWQEPRDEFLLCESRLDALLAAQLAKSFSIVSPYRCIPWGEMTSSQMSQIEKIGAPSELLPRLGSFPVDDALSIALLYDENLVGWLLLQRIVADVLTYSSLYVSPAHRGRARGIALIVEGFMRQKLSGISRSRAAIRCDNSQMMRIYRRRLCPVATSAALMKSASVSLGVVGSVYE